MPPKKPRRSNQPKDPRVQNFGSDVNREAFSPKNPAGSDTDDPGPSGTDVTSTRYGEADRRQRAEGIFWKTARESKENHYKSDVDSNRLAQHHTLGTGANQASPGNHVHNGQDSLPVVIFKRVSWTPAWSTQNDPQPALGDGVIEGDYVVKDDIVYFSLSLEMGSTTTYGTGDFRFSLPVTPGSRAFACPPAGYIINGGFRSFPLTCNIENGRINNIYPSGAIGTNNVSLGNGGWGFAWQQFDKIRINGWYWIA